MIPFQYVPEIFAVFFLKFSSHGLVFLFFQLFANRMTRGQECTAVSPGFCTATAANSCRETGFRKCGWRGLSGEKYAIGTEL